MLTPLQSAALRFISAEVERCGAAPTLDEIAAHLGFASKSNAKRVVDCLVERGAVRRLPQRERALQVVRDEAAVERDGEAVACLRRLVALADADLQGSRRWARNLAWARSILSRGA